MHSSTRSKLYTRHQGGIDRYYADLRDIGGGQRALKTPGTNRATDSETEALKLLGVMIEEIEGRPWTVAKELGHKNVARVEDTYGHPSHFRPRGEVVEYRL